MPTFFVLLVLLLAAIAAALVWPRHGILKRWRRSRELARRVLIEDFLKHIHARRLQGTPATVESLAGSLDISISRVVAQLAEMKSRGLVRVSGVGLDLTQVGDRMALQVIRAHRLLERYMADELRMPLGLIHAEADRREHTISPAEVDELEARLGYPRRDPHGDPIPSSSGHMATLDAQALIDWSMGRPARIVHLEDEPPEVFAEIERSGLILGMHVEVLDVSDGRLTLWDGKREYTLTAVAAANVFVSGLPHPIQPPLLLSSLGPGETGLVVGLECEGLSRRRLLDLGLTPGTEVTHEYDAALGDPRAFRVRGALVALRDEDADRIEIRKLDAAPDEEPQ